jgi:hypothetical protein
MGGKDNGNKTGQLIFFAVKNERLEQKRNPIGFSTLSYIWAITEKNGICFLNPGFVFWFLVIFFVELNFQIIRKNKQFPI